MKLHELRNEFLSVKISPDVGGSIFEFKYNHGGSFIDIMRKTDDQSLDNRKPGNFASFSLIPYSFMFRDGLLNFGGETFRLYKNCPDEHKNHGEVRFRPMKVKYLNDTFIALSLDSKCFNDVQWPFPFETEVTYEIVNNAFIIEFTLKNTGEKPMPAGLGIHPYFVKNLNGVRQNMIMKIPVKGEYPEDGCFHSGTWSKTADCKEFAGSGKVMSGGDIDKCYRMDGNESVLTWSESDISVRIIQSDVFSHFVIYYLDENGEYYAAEPVTHCNDGFNMHESGIADTGTLIINPDCTIEGKIQIRVDDNILL